MYLLYRGETFDPNFFYHSKIDIDHSFLLFDKKKKILFVSAMNEAIAKEKFKGELVIYKNLESIEKYIKGEEIGCDFSSISASLATKLNKITKISDCSEILSELRRKKSIEEVNKTKKAVQITKEILDGLDFKVAKTELDIKKQLLKKTVECGVEMAFEPIVSTDQTTSFPHYRAGTKKIGGLVLVDYGVKYDHYCADLTRCFILDGDKKKKEEYEKLQTICFDVIDNLGSFKLGSEVGLYSEDRLIKAGFPKLIHSIGHGVGLEVHEKPSLGKLSKDKIETSILAIEPAFYLKKYGMRYEETIYFDGKKGKIL